MKFYNREDELTQLAEIKELAYTGHSKLTVLTGRRRVGKTSLIFKALEKEPFVYLFVGRKNETDLCQGYVDEIAGKLGIFVPKMDSFVEVFRFLMEQGVTRKFSLVIDEFQEFLNVNPSVYSDIQNYWDQYRTKTNINFVVSGSIYSLMVRLFQDKKEPLFGRADNTMRIRPFTSEVLKEIMADYHPAYTNDDLLALYTFTGGVPKYVELLADHKALTIPRMINQICRSDSPFLGEGRNLLIEEFGKKYGNYFSILSAISFGINTQSEIEAHLGDKSIGGQLSKLEAVYEVISKQRPIFAKAGTQTVRYEISDNFLRFWFRYIERNRPLVEIGNFPALKNIVTQDYTTYSGKTLELYFKQKMQESFEFRSIGSWWESKGENEIDIVAILLDNQKAVAAEVKRQKKNFKPEQFARKVEHLKNKVLSKYTVEAVCLSLEDM